jgi:hypothetical protein
MGYEGLSSPMFSERPMIGPARSPGLLIGVKIDPSVFLLPPEACLDGGKGERPPWKGLLATARRS